MKIKVFIVSLLLSILVIVGCVNSEAKPKVENSVVLLQKGKNRDSCIICGMKLAMFYKTNHASTVDGKARQYCSIHCLAEDKSIDKNNVKNMKVVALDTMKFIPVEDAIYVVGSDMKGTMSSISKYAFSGRMNARRFAQKHQGKIMNFDKAYEYALKDFSASKWK